MKPFETLLKKIAKKHTSAVYQPKTKALYALILTCVSYGSIHGAYANPLASGVATSTNPLNTSASSASLNTPNTPSISSPTPNLINSVTATPTTPATPAIADIPRIDVAQTTAQNLNNPSPLNTAVSNPATGSQVVLAIPADAPLPIPVPVIIAPVAKSQTDAQNPAQVSVIKAPLPLIQVNQPNTANTINTANLINTTTPITQVNQNTASVENLSPAVTLQEPIKIKEIGLEQWQKIPEQSAFNQRIFTLGESSELESFASLKQIKDKQNQSASNQSNDQKVSAKETDDLWQRIRQGFKMPVLNSELVENRRNWYLARPDYFMRINERAKKYLYHIVDEVEKRNMPTELALLPIIESAFNPTANSNAKAAGIWQFMPKTGRYFNLNQSALIDERRDVLQSTQAALDYLQKLHGMFGDWHLALAAYNWGEGSVMRAIQRNQSQGLPTDYLSLRMPEETRYYVPKLMGVRDIIENPTQYQANLPSIPNHPYFAQIPIKRDIDVAQILSLSGLSMPEFLALNPAYKKPVIAAANSPSILLPWEQGQKVAQTLEDLYQKNISLSSYTVIKLTQRERIESIAQRFNTSSEIIRDLNKVSKGMRFGAGSIVLVPKTENAPEMISEKILTTGQIKTEKDLPDTRRVLVRAGRYDQIEKIADRYNVSESALRSWNSFENGLKPLQLVALVLPYRASFHINPTPPREVMVKPKVVKVKLAALEQKKNTSKKIAQKKEDDEPVAKAVLISKRSNDDADEDRKNDKKSNTSNKSDKSDKSDKAKQKSKEAKQDVKDKKESKDKKDKTDKKDKSDKKEKIAKNQEKEKKSS